MLVIIETGRGLDQHPQILHFAESSFKGVSSLKESQGKYRRIASPQNIPKWVGLL